MSALDSLSTDEDCSDPEKDDVNPIESRNANSDKLVSITYEALRDHGLKGGPSLLEIPDPEAEAREKKRQEDQKKAEEDMMSAVPDVPLIKNAFGKWQFEGSDPRRKRAATEHDAEEESSPKQVKQSQRDMRAQALRDQGEAIVAAQETFSLDDVFGVAEKDRALEAESRQRLQLRRQQEMAKMTNK
eukprot:CAMPEP_0114228366 /NCGR_PEP_ID=MMETSP0058-20121206/2300_1 /TAXON_ID=36894 /ORGANISM="Pyramimonas parkeae, CCMP726" /LENGTH=186 /DNA_ID=CAMNT_0001339299 /DNA_START=255 /DNA_END=815 /DNA_ORIENTATION=-